jgi:hypothetical protein
MLAYPIISISALRERVERGQDQIGLGVRQIHDQDRDFGVGRGFGPEVSVDDLQGATGHLADQDRIDVGNLGQDAPQRVLLGLGMLPPVLGVRAQFAGADATKALDAVADLHGAAEALYGFHRWPTGC